MKEFIATVTLVKHYANPWIDTLMVQKKCSSYDAAQKWINKTLDHFGGKQGVKGRDGQKLCFVSEWAIDDTNGNQRKYVDLFE